METTFKSTFNEELWNQYMENTPTSFPTPFGTSINFRQEHVKNILVDLRDMFVFEMDIFQVSQGDEGAGKTHFMCQLAYVYYWFMQKLGMINYEWDLDLIYFSLDKMNADFSINRNIPFRISILDEGDELSGENFWQPNNQKFRAEMRRGRKFAKLVFLNMPQAKELTSRLATTRCQKFYQVDLDRETDNFDLTRGDVGVWGIPRGKSAWSAIHQEWIPKNKIRNTLSSLFKSKDDFIRFPIKLKLYDLRCNGSLVFDKAKYKIKAAKETTDLLSADVTLTLSNKDKSIFSQLFLYLAENKLIKDIFKEEGGDRRAFFRLRNKLFFVKGDK